MKVTKYVLAFAANTASYRVHAEGCSAAVEKRQYYVFEERFGSIDEARAFADADETVKAGEPVKAIFKVCKCAKTASKVAPLKRCLHPRNCPCGPDREGCVLSPKRVVVSDGAKPKLNVGRVKGGASKRQSDDAQWPAA